MGTAVERLKRHESSTPSRWREDAEWRRANRCWLLRSQAVAMKLLDKMDQMKWTQQEVAERLGCSQQYISRIVKGNENLSLEMLSKIEDNLCIQLFVKEL